MKIFESEFPEDYRKEEIKRILNFVTTGQSCQIICAPGAGKATILRLLAHNRPLLKFQLGQKEENIRFIYLNLLELEEITDAKVAKLVLLELEQKTQNEDLLILSKQLTNFINDLAQKGTTVVFLFDHFDEYQFNLKRPFYQLLRGLKSVAKYKFACVFATRRDLKNLVDEQILKEFYDFFLSNTVNVKIYDEVAINFLFKQLQNVFTKNLDKSSQIEITRLTSGHLKLTKVITELKLQENIELSPKTLLSNSKIRAVLFELWLNLTAEEQEGLSQNPQNAQIPLFAEFIKQIIPTTTKEEIFYDENTHEIKKGQSIVSDLLSPQEYRLLKFLIQNKNKVVSRDELISAVWKDAQSEAGITDEAIDQMIFRLRKKIEEEPQNPKHITTVKGQGFRFQS